MLSQSHYLLSKGRTHISSPNSCSPRRGFIDEPNVTVGRHKVDRWVALSYCWGGSSDFVLTEKSYSRLLHGVPVDQFPRQLYGMQSLLHEHWISNIYGLMRYAFSKIRVVIGKLKPPKCLRFIPTHFDRHSCCIAIYEAGSSALIPSQPSCGLPLENGTLTRDFLEIAIGVLKEHQRELYMFEPMEISMTSLIEETVRG